MRPRETREGNNHEVWLRATEPLILLGMHRSGTSLTVRLLADAGIHMGSWLSRDAEAVHFQIVNRAIYDATGSNWGRVDALVAQMRSPSFVEHHTELARDRLFRHALRPLIRPRMERFLGDELWRKVEAGEPFAWGWKDPRTTLTFPIWLRIFPNARWVYIMRNGIDVAISLHRRAERQQQAWSHRLFGPDFVAAALDFDYCFRLWEQHMAFMHEHQGLIRPDRYLQMRYEDLLADPEPNLRRLLAFAGQEVSDDTVRAACRRINRSRLDNKRHAAAYREQIPRLVVSPLMQQLGYSYQVGE